jgi:hypothetical protein
MYKNKKGSHVGIVLSFVIFVTFLVFLYSVLEPEIRIQQDKESYLDYLKEELMERVSANLTTITVAITKSTLIQNCVNLENLINEAGIDSLIIVKDQSENIVESNISEGDSTDLLIDREDGEKVFFKIYNSEEFPELEEAIINPCSSLEKDEEWEGEPVGYSIRLILKEGYVFEKKVIELLEEYESEGGYENLRNELKIPSGTEFGFSFIYNNGTRIETKEKEIPTKVQVREIPVQYIDKESNVLLGTINIKIW